MDSVANLLSSKGIVYKIQGQDLVVKCLNPDHEDKDPSMRIDKVTGAFNCFSCGFKGNIFKHFGLLTNTVPLKIAKLKEKIKNLMVSHTGLPLPEGATPFSQPFRGISKETLKIFGAFYTNSSTHEELQDRIVFPLKDISGRVVVYLGRHLLSDANPRYIVYPRGVALPLYPVTFIQKYNSAVLVEGIFDLLNLYDKGLYNVTCTFGTSTLKKNTKEKLLPLKAQGIVKIFLMFDGDDAGRNAMQELKPLIEEAGFTVEIIKLEDDSDPGELDEENVRALKEYINGQSSSN
jgi:DNA primase